MKALQLFTKRNTIKVHNTIEHCLHKLGACLTFQTCTAFTSLEHALHVGLALNKITSFKPCATLYVCVHRPCCTPWPFHALQFTCHAPCVRAQALLHTLAPGYEDMSEFKANGSEALATREAAVVAALRVVNSVLRLDVRFLADTGRSMGVER